MPVRNSDKLVERLNGLHNTSMTWREIATLDEYKGIPPGTLCTIANTGQVPKKWRSRFGLPALAPAPVCHRCGDVHVAKRCTQYSGKRELITLPPVGERPALLAEIYARLTNHV